jgi:hypothetical protein
LSHWQRAAITQKYASAKLARVDANRSETAILMEAMLRAHDVLACCTYRSRRLLAPIHHQPGGEKKRLISS